MHHIVREVLPELPMQKGQAPLGAKGEIIEEMSRAGFVDLQVESVRVPFAYRSASAFWQTYALAAAPIVATRQRVGPTQWPLVEERILSMLETNYPGPIEFDRFAWVAVGRKPTTPLPAE
jgi:hypothetical protein